MFVNKQYYSLGENSSDSESDTTFVFLLVFFAVVFLVGVFFVGVFFSVDSFFSFVFENMAAIPFFGFSTSFTPYTLLNGTTPYNQSI